MAGTFDDWFEALSTEQLGALRAKLNDAQIPSSIAAPQAVPKTSDTFDFDPDESTDYASKVTLTDTGPDTGQIQTLPQPTPPTGQRYRVLKLLGEGGMGQVLRVRDSQLNRTVAMKVLRPKMLKSARALARFKEEAQIAAQLQHPGIIPVHDIGHRPDGSVYFTMKEVRGKTFEDVIDDVQVALENGDNRTEDGWGFRRLIDTFHRVCETVAYAHHRGVVHRDLKPENIMIGAFGEVLVLDWGLAKVLAEEQDPTDEHIQTDRSLDNSIRTRMGAVAGTPSFMAPEQAKGQIHKIAASTDVYGLGGILYAILAGRMPYTASNVRELLDLVADGEPMVAPDELTDVGWPVPEDLSEVAMVALSHRQRDRFADAGAMAAEIATWLDGARKREKALEVVTEANEVASGVPRSREMAETLEAEALKLAADVPKEAPEQDLWPAWEREAAAEDARDEADRMELQVLQILRNALSHAPDLPEALGALADRFHTAHREAEASGNPKLASQLEMQLRAHDRGRYAKYLKGDGALTLLTDPPNAEVKLFRYVEKHKRLVPVFVRDLGRTPIREVPLERGSFVLEISAEGHHRVTYPVNIERLLHWDGVPPDETEPLPIVLPKLGELAEDDCYIPAGWFWSGGNNEYSNLPLPWRRLWADAFVVKANHVTNRDVLEVLNWLVDRGREEEALAIVPREKSSTLDGTIIYGRAAEAHFELVPDVDGDLWNLDWPVMMMNAPGMNGYLNALSEKEQSPWRWMHELQWQKAARGVDGRLFPWGKRGEDRFARVLAHGPVPTRETTRDVSPYGVRHCAGNAQDIVCDPMARGTPVVGGRVITDGVLPDASFLLSCGSSWGGSIIWARGDTRSRARLRERESTAAFRPCRPFRS